MQDDVIAELIVSLSALAPSWTRVIKALGHRGPDMYHEIFLKVKA